MREAFNRLQHSSSIWERILYVCLRMGSVVLPSGRRGAIKAFVCRLIAWKPRFCRKVRSLGVTAKKRSPRLIVSLTSYPKRIGTVHRTISTLLTQTLPPDEVVLWLGEDKFPRKEADLPARLLRLRKFGLTIRWCRDIRSYTKLIPALKAYPDDIIITADDDIFYRPDWLESLYGSYLKDPSLIHCHFVDRIAIEKGTVLPYSRWVYIQDRGSVSYRNLLMGVGGVLYPPHVLCEKVFDEDLFMKVAPLADDLWFWAMAVLNGVKIKLIDDALCNAQVDFSADNSQALCQQNVYGEHKNDVQFAAILNAFPLVRERLFKS